MFVRRFQLITITLRWREHGIIINMQCVAQMCYEEYDRSEDGRHKTPLRY